MRVDDKEAIQLCAENNYKLPDLVPINGGIVVKAAMGTGKSHQLELRTRKHSSGLLLGARVSHCEESAKRYSEAYAQDHPEDDNRIPCYNTMNPPRTRASVPWIVTQYESIVHLRGRIDPSGMDIDDMDIDMDERNYSFVSCDEINAILRQALSLGTNISVIEAWSLFSCAIGQAKELYVADAFLDVCSMDVLNAIREEHNKPPLPHPTVYFRPGISRIYKFHESQQSIDGWIVEAVKASKRLFIGSARTLAFNEELAEMVRRADSECKVLHIHARTPLMARSIDAILAHDVVIASPTLTMGIDIQQNHFHSVVLFCSTNTLIGEESMQQSGRARNLIDNTVHVHVYQSNTPSHDLLKLTDCDTNEKTLANASGRLDEMIGQAYDLMQEDLVQSREQFLAALKAAPHSFVLNFCHQLRKRLIWK